MVVVDIERPSRVLRLRRLLSGAVPGSRCQVVGSLADGTADCYSDIDLEWYVGEAAPSVVKDLYSILSRLGPVDSVRWDPADGGDTCLAFIRFVDWPLFSRVDLKIVGRLTGVRLPGNWSATESALMNVVGALKAQLRASPEVDGLLERAFARIGVADPGGPPTTRMIDLVDAVAKEDPTLDAFALNVRAAVQECAAIVAEVPAPGSA